MQWVRGDVEEVAGLERDEIVSDMKTVVRVVGNDDELARNVPEHETNTDKQGPYIALCRHHRLLQRPHRLTRLRAPELSAMSYFLPHLPSGWHVDEAIKSEEDRVVVIRFGHDWDSQCMTMDETLYGVADKVQNFAVIYLVDITEVPDFNKVRLHQLVRTRGGGVD